MSVPRELPVVNSATCTGCGECVHICPTKCLALAHRIAWMPRPADCVSCAACVWVCPVDAIAMAEQAK